MEAELKAWKESSKASRLIGITTIFYFSATNSNDPKYITMDASIDGIPISNLEQFRVKSDFFNITIPKDNIYDSTTGTFKSISSGYLIIIKPLPEGEQVIRYSDQVNNPIQPNYNHAKDQMFKVTVKK